MEMIVCIISMYFLSLFISDKGKIKYVLMKTSKDIKGQTKIIIKL